MEDSSSLTTECALLRRVIGTIPDPRHRRGLVHPLESVLSLTVPAVKGGEKLYHLGGAKPSYWGRQ